MPLYRFIVGAFDTDKGEIVLLSVLCQNPAEAIEAVDSAGTYGALTAWTEPEYNRMHDGLVSGPADIEAVPDPFADALKQEPQP